MSSRRLRRFIRTFVCLTLALFLGLASRGASQSKPAAPPQQPEVDQEQGEAAGPEIKSLAFFPQAPSGAGVPNGVQEFMLEIQTMGLDTVDPKKIHVAVFPALKGVTQPSEVFSVAAGNSTLLAKFTGPASYLVTEVALSTDEKLVTYDTGVQSCGSGTKVTLTPQIVPFHQASNKYGNGVAKNFHAIQISIVNQCPMAVIVPLAGMRVIPNILDPSSPDYSPGVAAGSMCGDKGDLVPFSLDHVTSIFSTDRKLTGRRAVYFNTVQALATLGSALEPFFAHGFTQGVAILGGGFTTASKEILVDMSSQQLQNLTSQSFGATEQIASNGTLQKFIFVRQNRKCKGSAIETDLTSGSFSVYWEVSPASGVPPKVQRSTAAIR